MAGALRGLDPRLNHNFLLLSGVLANDPREDRGSDGEPVTLLLVAHLAPEPTESAEPSALVLREIEVPGPVAEKPCKGLRSGDSILLRGQIGDGDSVIAAEVHSGPPLGASG